MILIPLETRSFSKPEVFNINLVLDPWIDYEICAYNVIVEKNKGQPPGVACLSCDVVNPSITNPKQILARFSRGMSTHNPEFYKMDTFNLRQIIITLTGIPATPLAITLAIKPIYNAKKTQ